MGFFIVQEHPDQRQIPPAVPRGVVQHLQSPEFRAAERRDRDCGGRHYFKHGRQSPAEPVRAEAAFLRGASVLVCAALLDTLLFWYVLHYVPIVVGRTVLPSARAVGAPSTPWAEGKTVVPTTATTLPTRSRS